MAFISLPNETREMGKIPDVFKAALCHRLRTEKSQIKTVMLLKSSK